MFRKLKPVLGLGALLLASMVLTPEGMAAVSKLSQINNGGTIVPATDQGVAVRSGTTDELVSFGTLASLNAAPAGTLTGSTLASGVTASSLTSVGTIGAGVWQGTTIGATYLPQGSSSTFGILKCGSGTTCSAGVISASGGGGSLPFTVSANTDIVDNGVTTLLGTDANNNINILNADGTIILQVNSDAISLNNSAGAGGFGFTLTGLPMLINPVTGEPVVSIDGSYNPLLLNNSNAAVFGVGGNGDPWMVSQTSPYSNGFYTNASTAGGSWGTWASALEPLIINAYYSGGFAFDPTYNLPMITYNGNLNLAFDSNYALYLAPTGGGKGIGFDAHLNPGMFDVTNQDAIFTQDNSTRGGLVWNGSTVATIGGGDANQQPYMNNAAGTQAIGLDGAGTQININFPFYNALSENRALWNYGNASTPMLNIDANGNLQMFAQTGGNSNYFGFDSSGNPFVSGGANYNGPLSSSLGGNITIVNGIVTAFTPMP